MVSASTAPRARSNYLLPSANSSSFFFFTFNDTSDPSSTTAFRFPVGVRDTRVFAHKTVVVAARHLPGSNNYARWGGRIPGITVIGANLITSWLPPAASGHLFSRFLKRYYFYQPLSKRKPTTAPRGMTRERIASHVLVQRLNCFIRLGNLDVTPYECDRRFVGRNSPETLNPEQTLGDHATRSRRRGKAASNYRARYVIIV